MQKERTSTAPIAIRPKLPNQYVLVPTAQGVLQVSPSSGRSNLPSKPISITVNTNDKGFPRPRVSPNPAGINCVPITAHSAPLACNPLNYGSLDSRRNEKLIPKLPNTPNYQQSQFLQHSPALRSSLINNLSLASSYQSSEDNDSVYADSDFMDDGGNVTATPEIDEEEEDTLDGINPSIDLSQYPQFQFIHLGDDSASQVLPSGTGVGTSSASSIPFSTSCPENLARNRPTIELSEAHSTTEKDLKDRIKKDNHNKVERRRRYHINDRIQELGTLLPRKEDMKVNKGNILKSACDYVRGARQLEEEYKLMSSKIQDLDKVATCLVQRIADLEAQCNKAGVSIPKATADQEVSIQAVQSGRLFAGLSVVNNGLLMTSLGIGNHQSSGGTPLSTSRQQSSMSEKGPNSSNISPLVACQSPSLSRIPTVTGPRSLDHNSTSDANSELLTLLSNNNSTALSAASAVPVYQQQKSQAGVTPEAKLRSVPPIIMTPGRPFTATQFPVRIVTPQGMRGAGNMALRNPNEDMSIKAEPLTPAMTTEFCQAHNEARDLTKGATVSPDSLRAQNQQRHRTPIVHSKTRINPMFLSSPGQDVKPPMSSMATTAISDEMSAAEINLCNVVMDLDFSPEVPSAQLPMNPTGIVQVSGPQPEFNMGMMSNRQENPAHEMPPGSQNVYRCTSTGPMIDANCRNSSSVVMDEPQFDFDISMANM